MFGIARQLVGLESAAETGTARTLAIKARSAIDEMEEDLDELEIDPPSRGLTGKDLWPAIRSLGNSTLGEWSLGHSHGSPRERQTSRPGTRRIS